MRTRGLRSFGRLMIGSAFRANSASLADDQYLALLAREADILCPETHTQMRALHPSAGIWNFEGLDRTLAMAEANQQMVRGHALIYHNALPDWLTQNAWSDAELMTHCRDHVEQVAAHGRGRVWAWDVANELWHANTGQMKDSLLRQRFGPNYPSYLFRWAHAEDPSCHLVLNGNEWTVVGPGLTAGVEAISRWLDEGVPIHGIGTQLHLRLDVLEAHGRDAVASHLEPAIQALADTGLAVHVTELDIAIREPVTAAARRSQAHYYAEVVRMCLRNPAVQSLGFWGLSDRYSWVTDDFPGYEDYAEPLLYDGALKPKPALYAVERTLADAR